MDETVTRTPTSEVIDLPLDRIDAGNNDRTVFPEEEIRELADSIRENGLVQPITVRPHTSIEDMRFQIVAGERRFRAHQMLKVSTIRCLIEDLDEEQAAMVMLIENINRKDINPIDEANAFQSRIDRFGWTVEEIAHRTGKSTGVVQARLNLLNLDPDVQDALANGQFWIAGAADIAALDWNRQRLCVNAYAHNPKMTGAEWRALTRRLYKEQADEAQGSMLDPDDFMVVAEYVEISKQEQRPTTKHLIDLVAMMIPHMRFVAANASGATNADALRVECERICDLFDIDPNSERIRSKAHEMSSPPTE